MDYWEPELTDHYFVKQHRRRGEAINPYARSRRLRGLLALSVFLNVVLLLILLLRH